MIGACIFARKSYWQGRSSVLIADYMETEYRSKDPTACYSNNELRSNSESRPEGTNPDANYEVGPSMDSRNFDQKDKPSRNIRAVEPKKMHIELTDAQEFKSRTRSQSVHEIEEVSPKTDYQEPSNCNPNAEPEQSIGEAHLRTNVEEPSSHEDYDPSSMKGYRYLIQGEKWQEVVPKNLENKIQLRITNEEKLITLDKIWQCKGNLLGDWGDKDGQLKDLCLAFALYRLLRCRFDDYALTDSIHNTRRLLLDGILSRTQNSVTAKEENKGPEDLQEDTKEGLEGNEEQQGGIKIGNKSTEKQGSKSTGGPERETKQSDRAAEAQQEGEEQPNVHVHCRNGSTKEPNRDANQLDRSAQEEQGSAKELDRVAEEQQDVSKAENEKNKVKTKSMLKMLSKIVPLITYWAGKIKEDVKDKVKLWLPSKKNKVNDEIAERVFEITGAELSFLNDYMYSRLPIIFWSEGGLIFSILLYITVFATTVWIGVSIVHVYTPPDGDFTWVIHGHNVDVFITWGILFVILLKETWEILIYLFSDWTKVVLISVYVGHASMRNWLMEDLIWLLCTLLEFWALA